jgi:hypothetical protein
MRFSGAVGLFADLAHGLIYVGSLRCAGIRMQNGGVSEPVEVEGLDLAPHGEVVQQQSSKRTWSGTHQQRSMSGRLRTRERSLPSLDRALSRVLDPDPSKILSSLLATRSVIPRYRRVILNIVSPKFFQTWVRCGCILICQTHCIPINSKKIYFSGANACGATGFRTGGPQGGVLSSATRTAMC